MSGCSACAGASQVRMHTWLPYSLLGMLSQCGRHLQWHFDVYKSQWTLPSY